MTTQGEFFELRRGVSTKVEPQIEEPHQGAESSERIPAEVVAAAVHRRGLKDLTIPKLYYSISEVSRITGLEQYVLRYWETEFEELSPQKNRAGNRIYSNKDIAFILRIKDLLREKRYTIEGAKQILKSDREAEPAMDKTLEPAAQAAKAGSQLSTDDRTELRNAVDRLKQLFLKGSDNFFS